MGELEFFCVEAKWYVPSRSVVQNELLALDRKARLHREGEEEE